MYCIVLYCTFIWHRLAKSHNVPQANETDMSSFVATVIQGLCSADNF